MTEQEYSFFVSRVDWNSAHKALFTADGCENAGVFLCGVAVTETTVRLLAREYVPVPRELYQDRQTFHLEIAPTFYNDLVTRCENTGLHPVIIHSHPVDGAARYSQSDDFGESRLLGVLQSLLPGRRVASLLVTRGSAAGRRWTGEAFVSLRELRILDLSITSVRFKKAHYDALLGGRYDRQIRAFGREKQALLESLKVGIVGVGGTGSLTSEQAARLGVGTLLLIDNDVVEESNLSRLVGIEPTAVGQKKVLAMRDHLLDVSRTRVTVIDDSAIKQSVLDKLADCDVVFGCVDNDRTRAALNRFAYQYMIPFVDMGIRIDARSGAVTAAAGRVSIAGPDMACLRCSHHLSSERIRSESLPQAERDRLTKEGYVLGIDDQAPAVISLNSVISGLAVTAFLNIFVGLTGGRQPTTQIYDATSGSVFPVIAQHEPGCDVCDDTAGVKGLGNLQLVSAY